MAGRIRSIKPELLEDERTSALDDPAWRLFVSLWLLADDHGNARAGLRYLAAMVWQDTGRDVASALGSLVDNSLVSLYEVNGQPYLHIMGWSKHQRIDNAGKPRVPLPPAFQCVTGELAEDLGESPRPSEKFRDPPLDLRPTTPTNDHEQQEAGLKAHPDELRIWRDYCDKRNAISGGERYNTGNEPKRTETRRRQIKARLREFGADRLRDAVGAFLAPGSWWIENGRVLPEYVFRSTKQVELHLEPKPQLATGPAVATQVKINNGALPTRRETRHDDEQNGGTITAARS